MQTKQSKLLESFLIGTDADAGDGSGAAGPDAAWAAKASAAAAGGGISAKYGQGALNVSGDNGANAITIGRNAAGTILVNNGNVKVTGQVPTVTNTTSIQVQGQGGNDTIVIDDSAGSLPAVKVSGGNGDDTITGGAGADNLAGDGGNDTINGGAGNDTIAGGDGNDLLSGGLGIDTFTGGDGNDVVTGGDGDDTASLGAGDDTFVWNPGDDNDTVNGDGGADRLLFNGANIAENISISANGTRATFARDIAGITMNLGGMETIDFVARGGADTISVHDLTGTDVTRVNLDLSAAGNGGAGDGTADLVNIDGSGGNDVVVAKTVGSEVIVSGLRAEVHVTGVDAGLEVLNVGLGDGNDRFDASALTGPNLSIDGGEGNDVLVGSAANDTIIGGNGADTLSGGEGADLLTAGEGDDVVMGGAGNGDYAFLGNGDDVYGWAIGDGNDVVEGEGGSDRLHVNGSSGHDQIFVSAVSGRVNATSGGETVDASVERVSVAGGAGDDTIVAFNGLGAVASLSIDGGTGNDSITGADGADSLMGGDGNDNINGGIGADTIDAGDGDDFVNAGRDDDTIRLGAGNDLFVWNPGDGSDTTDGGAGIDKLQFNGANIGEVIDIAASGNAHATMTRNIATISMDLVGVEQIAFTARGGSDDIRVHDMAGTAVNRVELDLAGTPGTATGDTVADAVTLDGRASGEAVNVASVGAEIVVTGLAAETRIAGADAGLDTLTLKTGGGNDTIDATALAANAMKLTVDAGQGNDSVKLGAGDDVFVYHDGDGSDVVNGGAGTDEVRVDGTAGAEAIVIAGSGGHAIVTRNGAVQVDATNVEHITYNTGFGADNITVGNLAGTSVTGVHLDLAGDGDIDVVTLGGTGGDDQVAVFGAGAGSLIVTGIAGQTELTGVDAIDALVIRTGVGNDTINATSLLGDAVQLTLDGGDGNDTIVGGRGADLLFGGAGNDTVSGSTGSDVAQLGDGDDTFVWNPGDGSDIVHGDAGYDTLLFNGANIAETFDMTSTGAGGFFLTRNIGTVTMTNDGVENMTLVARGGADLVNVHDLTGSGVGKVTIDLQSSIGGGDGASDIVTIDGTSGNDHIVVSLQNGHLVVDGLAAQIVIDNFEAGDVLRILGLDGDDTISAVNLPAGMTLMFEGGNGDDALYGGQGNDFLYGGDGDDLIVGGPGVDWIDAGTGYNIVINDDPAPVTWETDALSAQQPLLVG